MQKKNSNYLNETRNQKNIFNIEADEVMHKPTMYSIYFSLIIVQATNIRRALVKVA